MARPNPNKLFNFFRPQRTRRTSADWQRRRRVTAQQISPRKARDHKAAHLIRQRRIDNRIIAVDRWHLRDIQKNGAAGYRCPDCEHIPLHPWEPCRTPLSERLAEAIASPDD